MVFFGWIVAITGHFLNQYQSPYANFMQGLGAGFVIIGSLILIIKKRNQKNEASSR
jgi:hypothetical protein